MGVDTDRFVIGECRVDSSGVPLYDTVGEVVCSLIRGQDRKLRVSDENVGQPSGRRGNQLTKGVSVC